MEMIGKAHNNNLDYSFYFTLKYMKNAKEKTLSR